MLAGDLDSVGGSECGKGILGSLVGDVDGTMGSGGISGGLSVVFTVFQTKGGWVSGSLVHCRPLAGGVRKLRLACGVEQQVW